MNIPLHGTHLSVEGMTITHHLIATHEPKCPVKEMFVFGKLKSVHIHDDPQN